ncbi:uncharacterized protein [Macrobrachium rosenbergii]|uniref:uncharacterized protein n=1 Tax=Macrobrachium rosenbergii TaxID=79674 RepID=UPI0034D5B2D5
MIIDWFTRYPEALPVQSTSSKNAIKALIHFFCHFGFPATIQSDEGRHFMSKEFRDSLASHGITHHYSTPYPPERCQLGGKSSLCPLLHQAGPLGNSRIQPVLYEAWADPERAAWADSLPSLQRNLRAAWAVAQAHEAATQERVKLRADKDARTCSFKVGDQVLVLRLGASQPLKTQFTGPHKILAWRGQLNYLVDCGKRRAKWLHINLLKPFWERAIPAEAMREPSPTSAMVGAETKAPSWRRIWRS